MSRVGAAGEHQSVALVAVGVPQVPAWMQAEPSSPSSRWYGPTGAGTPRAHQSTFLALVSTVHRLPSLPVWRCRLYVPRECARAYKRVLACVRVQHACMHEERRAQVVWPPM